jgi:FAD/FMN-containing dehydrogenase
LGKLIRHEDVVVPRSKIPDLIAYTEEIERKTGLKVASFGHAADGNIHVNILYEEDQKEIMERAVDMVIEKVWELGGTASGEHGIGLIKKKHLLLEQGEAKEYLIQKTYLIPTRFSLKVLLPYYHLFPYYLSTRDNLDEINTP